MLPENFSRGELIDVMGIINQNPVNGQFSYQHHTWTVGRLVGISLLILSSIAHGPFSNLFTRIKKRHHKMQSRYSGQNLAHRIFCACTVCGHYYSALVLPPST